MSEKRINKLLIATGNAHKFGEIAAILHALPGLGELKLLSTRDFPNLPEPDENGATFEANAEIKARAYCAATGLPALADDSGIVVDALDGRPGIHSARYAPTSAACIEKMLGELRGVPADKRSARFVCVVAFISTPDGRCEFRRGVVDGRITEAPRGLDGFGYDPIFELTEAPFAGRTAAELSADEKNKISHRARALALMGDYLAHVI